MKKYFSKFKVLSGTFVALLFVGALLNLAFVNAQAPDVVFNNGQGIAGIGDERDFLRINDANGGNTANQCTDGGTVNLWFYVHNTNPSALNGENNDGIGVARNTKVDINFANAGYVNNHEIVATVKADNSALAKDSAFIECAGKKIAIEYVGQSLTTNAPAWTSPYSLTGNIMNNATLGYDGGVVPGCFEYRAYIRVTVRVVVKEEPPVVSKQCLLAEPRRISRTRYDLTASAQVENTTVQSYTFTTKNEAGAVVDTKTFATQALSQTYEFDQPTAGRYTVKAVITTAAGVAEGDCERTVVVEAEPTTPAYSCDFFTLTFADRKATVSFKPVASNGATFKDTVIKYNADGANKQTTTTNAVNAEGKIVNSYTFAQTDKNVEAVATVRFNVPENGGMVVKEVTCKDAKVLGATSTVVNRPAPATSLPKTGMGEGIAGLMAATTAAGTALHRKFTLRRNK